MLRCKVKKKKLFKQRFFLKSDFYKYNKNDIIIKTNISLQQNNIRFLVKKFCIYSKKQVFFIVKKKSL